jgi:hypothetical protein
MSEWRPGYRHQVKDLPAHETAGWECVNCGQRFITWPPDTVECPGPRALERQLLQDIVDKATPYGEINEPGGPYVASYLLPTGPIHRALAYLRDGAIPARQEANR